MPEVKTSKMNHLYLTKNKEIIYRFLGILMTSIIVCSIYFVAKKYWIIFEYYITNHNLR